MSCIDVWAAIAAAVAAACLALRGEFLKPDCRAFATAATWVWLSLILLAAFLGARVVSLLFGGLLS